MVRTSLLLVLGLLIAPLALPIGDYGGSQDSLSISQAIPEGSQSPTVLVTLSAHAQGAELNDVLPNDYGALLQRRLALDTSSTRSAILMANGTVTRASKGGPPLANNKLLGDVSNARYCRSVRLLFPSRRAIAHNADDSSVPQTNRPSSA